MSVKTLCRLCVSLRQEYMSLYDGNDQGNDIYEITLKYFDPILLSTANDQDSKVICVECWRHISEFYGFQQSVLQAQAGLQTQLEEDVKQVILEVKVEDEVLLAHMPIEVVDATVGLSDNDEVKVEKDMSDSDVKDDNPFTSDDDEKPLIEHITKVKRKRRCAKKLKDIEDDKEKNGLFEKPRTTRSSCSKGNVTRTPKKTLKTRLTATERCKNHVKIRDEGSLDEDNTLEDSAMDEDAGDTSYNDKDAIIAQWIPELQCELCSATTLNFNLLRLHFRTEHPGEKCYIKCCERKFSKRCNIFEHIQLHIDPDVFKCNVCGKVSTNSRNLAKHIRDLHTDKGKERPFECRVCQKRFQNATKLRTHMDIHASARDHLCTECGKGFATEQRRKIHERNVHNVDRVCDQCGKTIHGIYALKQHLQEHSGVQKPKWPCDQCSDLLYSHSSLKRHKQLKHHDGSTAYICSDCGKIFPAKSALHSHKRLVHIMERKHKCDVCAKAFKFPKNLREHMASHTGIHLYQCPYCSKTFKSSANLHHHRKIAHPKEWAEARTNKHLTDKFNLSLVKNEIVI